MGSAPAELPLLIGRTPDGKQLELTLLAEGGGYVKVHHKVVLRIIGGHDAVDQLATAFWDRSDFYSRRSHPYNQLP